jgi:hypothetical protein
VGGTTAGATTYTTQQGAWWLFGPVMFVTGTVTWTAASGTGTARISLPIAAANVSNQTFGGSAALQSVTFANGSPQIVISPNTAYFILISPLTNAVSTNVAVEAAGTVVFSLFFAIE